MMDGTFKKRYPFRLGTTSFIYPADYETNVRKLAPILDEIELLLFEAGCLPSRNQVEELSALAGDHNITYNVHLPIDIDLAADGSHLRQKAIDAVAKTIDRVSPLCPTTHTLHIAFNQCKQSKDNIYSWQSRAVESMTQVLQICGAAADSISVETLDYSPLWLIPIVERLDLAICVDVGHLILYGFNLKQVLERFATRTVILHLHGVLAGRDHLSLIHITPNDRRTIAHYLRRFKASISIEVFSLQQLSDSLACFPDFYDLSDTGNEKISKIG